MPIFSHNCSNNNVFYISYYVYLAQKLFAADLCQEFIINESQFGYRQGFLPSLADQALFSAQYGYELASTFFNGQSVPFKSQQVDESNQLKSQHSILMSTVLIANPFTLLSTVTNSYSIFQL